jgi:hypothetical protein
MSLDTILKVAKLSKAKLSSNLNAMWTKETMPHFLTKTTTPYCKVPIADFTKRNMCNNRLFDNICEYLPKDVIIAGGFMRSVMQEEKDAKDIDYFFLNAEALKSMFNLLMDPPEDAWAFKGYKLATEEPYLTGSGNDLRYILFKHEKNLPDIQLIKLVYYDDAEHVIDSFDFTCVQFASDGANIIFNPMALSDIQNKRIVLHRMQFPTSTMRRLIKYANKGYYACPGSLSHIAKEMNKLLIEYPYLIEGYVYID